MSRNRMVRSDSRDAAVAEATGQVMDFFETHGRNLIIALGVLAVLVVAGLWIRSSMAGDERAAAARLSEANIDLSQGRVDAAAAKLTETIQRHGGSKSGKRARLTMGSVEMARGNYAAADAQFQAFLSGLSPEDFDWVQGQRGRAAALENTGKYADAARIYEDLLKGRIGDEEKGKALLDAARARRLAGDTAGARALYGRIEREFSGTRAVAQARIRQAEIGGK